MLPVSRWTTATLLLADGTASLLAFVLSVPFSDQASAADSGLLSLAIPFFLACLAFFAAKGHYILKASLWPQVLHILGASAAGFVLSALVIYAWQVPVPVIQDAFLWLFMTPCLVLMRSVARYILVQKGLWAIPTVLVGHYETLIRLVPALKAETYLIYDVQRVFLLEADNAQVEEFKQIFPGTSIYSSIDTLSFGNSYVFFCPKGGAALHDKILARLEKSHTRFAYVPPAEGYFFYGAVLQRFFGQGVVALEPGRKSPSGLSLLFKDVMDRVAAAIALVLLSPILLVIAWAIRKDGGPAMYGHRRIGKDGRLFTCLKFRSMVVNAGEILERLLANDPALRKEYEETYKLKNDPRVTKIGKFLRKTSLDELPQLLNVLRGDMSLTGPRPIVEDERKYYAEKIGDYLSVRPGITGLWQVSGRNDTDYNQRVYLDSWYVRNWSLWNDVIILFKTVSAVLKRKGAY